MNLCSDHHDEICFEGRHCPACEMRRNFEDVTADLQHEIRKLKNEINQMEDDYYPCQHAECEAMAKLEKV